MQPKRKCVAALAQQCYEWNSRYTVGTVVRYHPVIGEHENIPTRTRSVAQVLGGHTAVIFVDLVTGCVALEAVELAEGR